MDHYDHIESSSVERRKLMEKRIEMIAVLINQMNEEGNNENSSKKENKRKSINERSGILTFKWLGRFVNIVHRMFP